MHLPDNSLDKKHPHAGRAYRLVINCSTEGIPKYSRIV